MEILRHKDIIDELVKSGDKIMNTCTEEEKQTMKVKFLKLQLQQWMCRQCISRRVPIRSFFKYE